MLHDGALERPVMGARKVVHPPTQRGEYKECEEVLGTDRELLFRQGLPQLFGLFDLWN